MKKFKSILFIVAVLLILQAGSVSAMAASGKTPADIVAALTGRSVEDVIQERMDTGKTYGRIAKDSGKLDEFKEECLELKAKILKENVADGLLSQAEADSILAAIKANQAFCDGSGYGCGRNQGYGCGRNQGYGRGKNQGYGRGCYGMGKCRNLLP